MEIGNCVLEIKGLFFSLTSLCFFVVYYHAILFHMDPLQSIQTELKEQRAMIDKIFLSVEKTRKYYLWTMWGTVVVFVLPLIGLAIAIPAFVNTYSSALNGAGLGL